MPRYMPDHYRMTPGHRVKVPTCRRSFVLRMVEAVGAHIAVVGFGGNRLSDHRNEIVHRPHRRVTNIDGGERFSCSEEVVMGIDHAGEHRPSSYVDDLSAGKLGKNLRRRSDSSN